MTAMPQDDLRDLEPPGKPEWVPGKPGFISRRLMKLAGVDMTLARNMPGDEQQMMRRTGAALLLGTVFQAISFNTALIVAFGLYAWTVPVTLVLTGIMFCLDAKFVAGDWAAQGAAFCRSRGLIPEGHWFDRWKRLSGASLRWGFSLAYAGALTVLVLLRIFEPDIESNWTEQGRVKNQHLLQSATEHYQAVIGDVRGRISESYKKLDRLSREHSQFAFAGSATADIDRQINDLLAQIKTLDAAKVAAEKAAAEHHGDVRAEEYGVVVRPENTGKPGKGRFHDFHADMARDDEAIAQARAADIDKANNVIADLRRQRAAIVAGAQKQAGTRLETIERLISEEQARRSALGAELRQLEDGREKWIAARMREAPNYWEMPTGLLAKLQALAEIIASNAIVATLAFFAKIVIVGLETAGPIAKMFFTPVGIYQISLALRASDYIETEADKRLRWQHWRAVTRNRTHEAMDAVRRRHQAARHTQAAYDAIFENLRTQGEPVR